jgi:cation-transporting P-type ATPase D
VNRGLAEYVEGEPPAVRLLFEPKGRPEDENNEFYIQGKTNRCVGCGEMSHYLRYRIIPSCYRQHFPEHLKSHRSHDIVLLCVDCHEIAHRAAERYKRQIAIEFAVPLFTQRIADPAGNDTTGSDGVVPVVQKKDVGVSPIQLRNAAMALLRHGTSMPVERRKELEEVGCFCQMIQEGIARINHCERLWN